MVGAVGFGRECQLALPVVFHRCLIECPAQLAAVCLADKFQCNLKSGCGCGAIENPVPGVKVRTTFFRVGKCTQEFGDGIESKPESCVCPDFPLE